MKLLCLWHEEGRFEIIKTRIKETGGQYWCCVNQQTQKLTLLHGRILCYRRLLNPTNWPVLAAQFYNMTFLQPMVYFISFDTMAATVFFIKFMKYMKESHAMKWNLLGVPQIKPSDGRWRMQIQSRVLVSDKICSLVCPSLIIYIKV